ncbi:MAG: hypothetical protein WC979_02650 [Candidatus Pacearchaeota archaeon]|jgi:hypothetical protein|nr:hypothetical protein [Clostridia bacterium]
MNETPEIWIPWNPYTAIIIEDSVEKICKTIESCTRQGHINACNRMIRNFEKYHNCTELTEHLYTISTAKHLDIFKSQL